jgi:hypothetical protein
MVANCFGDRWSYLEITGLLFVLVGAAVRASQLTATEATPELDPIVANMRSVRHDTAPQARVLPDSLNGQNPTGRLHSEALRNMLWAVPKLKMEIPDE